MLSAGIPVVPLESVHYFPNGQVEPVVPELDDTEEAAMALCLALAEEALKDGNPPIGAVLLDRQRGLSWGARTEDQTTGNILGHGELKAYNLAHPDVGSDLSGCTLVSTAQPCSTCTPPYAEGKIGKIVFAVPRPIVLAVSGIMRVRGINMHELLQDGATNTTVVSGYRAAEALELFARYRDMRETPKI